MAFQHAPNDPLRATIEHLRAKSREAAARDDALLDRLLGHGRVTPSEPIRQRAATEALRQLGGRR